MLETQLKQTITEYLQLQQKLGNLFFERLNAGSFPTQSGRWAVGCHKGAPDFVVWKKAHFEGVNCSFWYCRSILIELKGYRGKQSDYQKEYQEIAENQFAEYYVIKSVEELQEILEVS